MNIEKWIPPNQHIEFGRNPSYLNSLWVGLTYPFINLPFHILSNIITPFLIFLAGAGVLLFMMVGTTLAYFIVVPVAGIMGRLHTTVGMLEEDAPKLLRREEDRK